MKVSIGQKVKKGQLLAVLAGIDSDEQMNDMKSGLAETKAGYKDANDLKKYDMLSIKAEISQLNKQLKDAKDKATKKQLKSQIVSKQQDLLITKLQAKQEKEVQKLDIEKQEKAIKDLKKEGGKLELYSPVSGEVVGVCGGSGHMIQGGTAAVQIADMNKVRVKTEYINQQILGQSDSYIVEVKGHKYTVEVEEQDVDPVLSEMGNGEGLPTETYFDFNDSVRVPVGTFAILRLANKASKDGLVIPANALASGKSKEKYVYRKTNGAKEKVTVTTGTITDAYIQILSGLKEGDEVYVE